MCKKTNFHENMRENSEKTPSPWEKSVGLQPDFDNAIMSQLHYLTSPQYDPFLNRAVEQYLTDHQEEDTVTMYLWKNQQTVVIGYNQNPYSECNVQLLLDEGGHLMRRGTGGGAVYHDLGNINFSFVADKSLNT